ncbi:MAG: B12-binding domain-containing radical SAM protein [Armatimonadetes bacterium]|nr:B12-binding domain-containing radical SAM protein [Armatimonadota bacterium]
MKKIFLLGINARFTHSNLAIRYLRNFISDLPFEIVLEEVTFKCSLFEILANLHEEKPEIIGISVYIWNSEIVKKLLPEIKKILPESQLILGGPEVSYNPEQWLEMFSEIDHIVCGLGEEGFRCLLEQKTTEKIIHKQNPHFSKIKFPYLDSDFPDLKQKYIYFESSRGCPFRCSYCLSSRIDQKLEFRKFEQVKKELSFLIEKEPKIIKFVDRTFNVNAEHYRNIWKFLIELNPEIRFHFEILPNLLKGEDFKILERCPKDLFQFEIGIQSTNPKTLQSIHRNHDWKETKQKIQRLLELKTIHIHIDLIAGLPYEDFSTFRDSFNNIYELKPDYFQLGFLKILSGTEMSERTEEYEIINTNSAPYEVLKNRWLSFDELLEIHKIENLLNLFYNSHKFDRTISNLLEYFESSFDFYLNLVKFSEKQEILFQQKNWFLNAKFLIRFIKKTLSSESDYFLDCLRWDWCKIAKSHFYPEFLRTKETDNAKEIGYKYLKSLSIKGSIQIGKISFTVSDLKKAIFFQPSSDTFRKKYAKKNEYFAFIKTNDSIQIIDFEVS